MLTFLCLIPIITDSKYAGVAQPVEQLICNQQVGGSSPSTSSKRKPLTSVVYVFLYLLSQGKDLIKTSLIHGSQ